MNQEESKTDTRIKSRKRRPEATESTLNLPCPNQTQLQKYTIKSVLKKYIDLAKPKSGARIFFPARLKGTTPCPGQNKNLGRPTRSQVH